MATFEGWIPIGTVAPVVLYASTERARSHGRRRGLVANRLVAHQEVVKSHQAHTVDLLARDLVNVNDVLSAVDRSDLTLTAFVCTAGNYNLVILADWNRANL
jgi:hypothetical protein